MTSDKPIAAVISISQLEDVQAALEDLVDVAASEARFALSGGKRVNLDDVLVHFCYSRHELRQDPAYLPAHAGRTPRRPP